MYVSGGVSRWIVADRNVEEFRGNIKYNYNFIRTLYYRTLIKTEKRFKTPESPKNFSLLGMLKASRLLHNIISSSTLVQVSNFNLDCY